MAVVQMLVEGFNVAAADNVMCRNTVNVGWDGRIFDCDFNQQLDMGMRYAAHGCCFQSIKQLVDSTTTKGQQTIEGATVRTMEDLRTCLCMCVIAAA